MRRRYSINVPIRMEPETAAALDRLVERSSTLAVPSNRTAILRSLILDADRHSVVVTPAVASLPKGEMTHVSLYLSPPLLEALDRLVERSGRARVRSAIVRSLILQADAVVS